MIEWLLIGLCVAIALCPTRFDLAIRLKDWMESRKPKPLDPQDEP